MMRKNDRMDAVLCVDDDKSFLKDMESYLKNKGFFVTACTNTDEAAKIAESVNFGAIVSGHRQPGCDALLLLRIIRGRGDYTPFIVFSEEDCSEFIADILNGGADYYIPGFKDKKNRLEELSEKIGELIAGRYKETLFQSFFSKNNDLMFVKDEKFRYIIGNDALLKLLGLKPEELVSRTDKEFMDSDAARGCFASDLKAIETGQPVTSEEILGDRIYETMKFPLEIAPGKIGIGGIIRDITGRIEIERDLIGFRNLTSHILEAIPDVLIRTDKNGIFTDIYAGDKSLLILPKKELTGKSLTEIFPGHLGFFLMKTIQDAISQNKMQKIEYPLKINGRDFYYEARVIPYLKDETITLIRDITERKEAEEDLKRKSEELAAAEEELRQQLDELVLVQDKLSRNEAYIRTVLDNIPIGIAVNSVKPEVKFEYMNQNFLKFYRVSEEDLNTPDSFWDLVFEDPDFREKIRKRVLKDSESGDPEQMHWDNLPITRKGEKTTYISAQNIPLEEKGLVISMVWDVTDKKISEERRILYLSRIRSLLDLYNNAGRSKDGLISLTLENSCSMTGSRCAFIGLVPDGEDELIIHKWSKGVMKDCSVQGLPLHLTLKNAGIWAESVRRSESVIVNDYSLPNKAKKGVPKGHVEIRRFVSIPVFDGDKVAAVLVAANKDEDYNEDDTEALMTLGNLMWEILRNKETREELLREKKLFWRTFESLRDAAFILGAHPVKIRVVNEAAVSLFGYDKKEMIGRTTDFIHVNEASLNKFRTHVYPYLEKHEKIPRFEMQMKKKDGTIFQTEHSVNPLFDSEKNHAGWVSIVRDITDIRESKKHEKILLNQIEANMEQLATLNDQIRNPLAVITGLVEIECPNSADKIITEVMNINKIISMLDKGWIKSEKIWDYLRTHYGVGIENGNNFSSGPKKPDGKA
ncbi:MAG: PAS domain S-box protein [Methanomicrobiaceae archaeon]|nr:PAS domain S-box protein [Methanomicrobiaceae archaeon]